MKNLLIFSLCLSGFVRSFGQVAPQTEGMITYERRQYWTKVYEKLTFLTKDEKERQKSTWGNDDEWKVKMKLVFNANESVYTYLNETGESDDGTYNYRLDDFKLYRNFAQERKIDQIEMLGKTYVIEDSIQTPNWKILNEIKEVAGYVCMKATTEDKIKQQKITAWFSQDLALPFGPENYHGLPGVILELNIDNGTVIIEATKVELKDNTKPSTPAPELEAFAKIDLKKTKKMKGKRINNKDYDQLLSTHMKDSIKAQRNPYWSIRY
ncbi:MAG: GLPGLI family protein [Runella slithyformis]|nr:MAG: GLPGLI family protein [Runella slithyformis]TAF94694.1 MAG: GLPGLI family protein [Runella sp.]TAG16213.1 MAG: GLPGLI family protein [Cytophagales bacterium]TAG35477.1 MAG: GLPGLI family protein [Cytophagia bacterium]TAE98630.1 MAG: GLPGLI family protein [Runella slithyformis]